MNLQQVNFNYSLKNIPIPNNDTYMKCMVDKVDNFIKRLRWKAFFFEHPESTNTDKNNFNFKSEKTPPQHDGITPFENDLYELIKNIKFSDVNHKFQSQLNKDINTIKSSNTIFVQADKSTNLYQVKMKDYKKLLVDNVTATYQETERSDVDNINMCAKIIASKLDLDDRIEALSEQNAFITIKDHKPNFPNNLKCRLINPSKSEIGKISKQLLDNINSNIRNNVDLNQWRNTSAVISWFRDIPDKHRCKFMKFDIVEFYPSISEDLLWKALKFAEQYTDVPQDTIDIIMHARNSLLFCDGKAWTKQGSNLFDVTMGSFDGAEVCELVGLYLLFSMRKLKLIDDVGLYRDDGLAIIRNQPGNITDRIRKNLIKLFQENNLKITVDLNLTQTDFLDTTLNLISETFCPYRKPNDQPLYININSNHPPAIKAQIPRMVGDRLSNLSSTKKEFEKAAPVYNQALKNSGHKEAVTFNKKIKDGKKRRKRNVVWFNPPFSQNTKSNIGKEFFKLIDKHFPPHHRLHKICNRNNVKLSYSCLPNIGTIITNHNKKLLVKHQEKTTTTPPCNCKNKSCCPLQGACREKSLVYQATIQSGSDTKLYYGSCSTEFKKRFYNHNQSFVHSHKRNATELSKAVWRAKDKGDIPTIKWAIKNHAPAYRCGGKRCNLCLTEKLAILRGNKINMLNKRSEITGKCRHINKFKLSRINITGSL